MALQVVLLLMKAVMLGLGVEETLASKMYSIIYIEIFGKRSSYGN